MMTFPRKLLALVVSCALGIALGGCSAPAPTHVEEVAEPDANFAFAQAISLEAASASMTPEGLLAVEFKVFGRTPSGDIQRANPSLTFRPDNKDDIAQKFEGVFGAYANVAMRRMEDGLLRAKAGSSAETGRLIDEALANARKLRHYEVQPDILITPASEEVVNRIGNAFHKKTGLGVTVTSGTRTPRRQADAMLTKAQVGGNLRAEYRNKEAVDEIIAARKSAQGKPRAEVVNAMAAAIEKQMARGVYISNHLKSGAVDLKTNNLSAKNKAKLIETARSVPGVTRVLDESKPPHLHLDVNP
jgi:hypothetical protein